MAPYTIPRLDWMSGLSNSSTTGTVEKHKSVRRGDGGGQGQKSEEEETDVQARIQAQALAQQDDGAGGLPITTVETPVHAAEMTMSRRQIVWFSRGGSVKCVGDVREPSQSLLVMATQLNSRRRERRRRDKRGRDWTEDLCECVCGATVSRRPWPHKENTT